MILFAFMLGLLCGALALLALGAVIDASTRSFDDPDKGDN